MEAVLLIAICFWGYLIHHVLCDIKIELYNLHDDLLKDNKSKTEK
jgi:hypothetical protein